LHLGNILFIKNKNNEEYKIGIIDYGICLKLDVKEQNFLDKLFTEYINNFDLYNFIEEVLNHIEDKYNINENNKIILEEVKTYINNNNLDDKMIITHHDIYTFVKISKKYNLIIPQRIYCMLLSFVSIMGTLNKFLSIFNNNEEKKEYLKNNIFK
jgi:predicted unusual protein kinase regulating ubiquinone biosynthesis (AarF/ABC1/UbiB family)